MSDNAEIANNGTELYINKLFELADEFMKQFGDDEKEAQKNFRGLIFYLRDRIKQPDNDDIEGLNNLFNAYVRLCVRYRRLPTIQCFSWLAKIHRSTLNDWKNGVYRSSDTRYADTIKEMHEVCKSFVIDELTNNSATNVNLIFVSKACYGLRETSPLPVQNPHQLTTRTPEEIATGYGMAAIEDKKGLPEVPE